MINEHKKGVKAVKYSLKTKNPVAKAHQTVGSGSGAHSDKKKNASVPRKEKHKKAPELAESNWYSIRLKTMLEDASHDDRNYPDHEIKMASSELLSIAKNASELLDVIRKYSEQKGLDAWQQSKITKAADYLNTVLQSINGEQQGVAEVLGDSGFNAMMGKITDPAARERLLPVEIQKVVQFLKGSIESLIEVLKSDPDFQPNDVRNSTDLRDMRKNLKSVMVDSDPKNVANAIFNYETEWRETMNEWAEEALGIELFTKLQNLYYGEYGEGVAEANGGHAGSAKVRYTGGMHGTYEPTKQQSSPQAHLDAAKYHDNAANTYITAMNSPKALPKNTEWYKREIHHHKNKADFHRQSSAQQGVAEGRLNEGKGLEGELARFLKSNGFKGPYRLGKLPKWAAELSEFDKTDLIMVQGNDVEYDEFVVDIGYGQLYWGAEGGMTKMTEKAIVNHVKLGQQGVEEDATENVDINNTLSNIEKAIYRQKLQGEEASDKLREYLLDVALNAVGRDKRKFYEPHVMNVNNWDDAREFLNTVFRDASEQGLQETKSNWYQVRLSTMLESKLK